MSGDKLPTEPVAPMTIYKRSGMRWRIVKESVSHDPSRIQFVIERTRFGILWDYCGHEASLEEATAKLQRMSNAAPIRREVVYETP